MKKLFILLLACVLAVTGGIFLASCTAKDNGDYVTEDHIEHSYIAHIVEPTCKEEGYTEYTCSCGDSYRDNFTPPQHDFEDNITVLEAATCVMDGIGARRCKNCGELTDQIVIPKETAQHLYSEYFIVDIESNCAVEGLQSRHCILCDAKTDEKPVPVNPDAHDYEDFYTVDEQQTCSTEGIKSRHCKYCDSVCSVTTIHADGKSHVFSEHYTIIREANCIQTGYEAKHCEYCEFYFEGRELPMDPDNHFWEDDYTIDVEATCISEGSKSIHCCLCEEHTDQTVIPIDSHNHSYEEQFTVDIQPDCVTEGSQSRHCSRCGDKTDITVIPVDLTTHIYSDWNIIDSVHSRTCSVCNQTFPEHHHFADGECTECGFEPAYTAGLEYEEDGENAIKVVGIGDAENVEDIVLPSVYDGKPLTVIGINSFANNTVIKSIYIPESIVNIEPFAFDNCSNLQTVYFNATNCNRDNGYDFPKFSNSLTDVIFGNGVTVIPDYMLAGCNKLTNVNLPESLKIIGTGAFGYCTLINSIEFPAGLEIIGDMAFNNCKGLTKINITDGVKSIGYGAFKDCTNVEELVLPDTLTELGKESYWDVFYNVKNISKAVIPALAANKFVHDELVTLTITSGELANNAFKNTTKLKSVTIGDGVTSTGYDVFSGCTALTDVKLGTGLTCISAGMFYNCSLLESIEIPDNITSLEEITFYNCKLLSDIKLSENITYIGNKCFGGCEKITSFDMPASVKQLGNNIFGYNDPANIAGGNDIIVIERINITDAGAWGAIDTEDSPLKYDGVKLYLNGEQVKEVVIPYGAEKISGYAFYGCTELTSIEIPETVTEISQYAFEGCTKLEKVEFTGVKTIGKNAFNGCVSLTEVSFAEGLEDIEANAFTGCSQISSLVLPDGIKTIGLQAFMDCTALEEVSLGEGLYYVMTGVFNNCTSLKKVKIPQSVKEIEAAFVGCNSLEIISIPFVGRCRINDYTFPTQYCFGYIFGASSYTTNAERVPSTLKTVMITGSTEIYANAFNGCDMIENLGLSNTIEKVGENAFEGCTSLNKIYYMGDIGEWYEFSNDEESGVKDTIIYNIGVLYYQETPTEHYQYWHFDIDGVTPIRWIDTVS